jgi:chaperonin GroEL
VLVEGGFDEEKKTERIRQLIQQSTDATNPYEKEQLDHRIARLTGGVAVLRVGAYSEPAMIEKKARAEDAVHACRGALEAGVVPGGGVALLRASKHNSPLFEKFTENGTRQGAQILLNAIREPATQIVRNAGRKDAAEIVSAILRQPDSHGYDAAHGTFGDMYEAGVVDPAKVALIALEKSASIGALLLTTEVLVSDIPEPKQAAPSNIPAIYRG